MYKHGGKHDKGYGKHPIFFVSLVHQSLPSKLTVNK